METRDLSDEELLGGLRDHQRLRSRIAALLELAQGTNADPGAYSVASPSWGPICPTPRPWTSGGSTREQ